MKKPFAVVPVCFLLSLALSCRQPVEEGITENAAKSIGDLYVQARNEADLVLLDQIYSPDVVVHDSSSPQDIIGLAALKEFYSNTHRAMPDLHAAIDEMIVRDHKIVMRWTFSGTHTGLFQTPLGDIPATGKTVRFSGVAIDRVVQGKVVEEWVYFNVLDFLLQLGFTLNPPQSPEHLEEKN